MKKINKQIISVILVIVLILSGLTIFGTLHNDKKEENKNSVQSDTVLDDLLPEGCIYIKMHLKETVTEGAKIEEVKRGDIIIYQGYRYCFEKSFNKENRTWIYSENLKDKWYVEKMDDREQGILLTEIFTKKVVDKNF